MAWCEDCGLSSCYERGGYCDTARRKMDAKRDRLKPNVAIYHADYDDEPRWIFCCKPGQLWEKGLEWIEVVWP